MSGFQSFVIFAAMRTGSNFLEENINDYPGLHCWGEAFNPHFIGHAGKQELLGIDMATREASPQKLLDAMRAQTEGLAGFRFFPGHDPRIMKKVLADRACAKIVLTRNPLESYVSQKIAAATGQWRLGDLKQAKSAKAEFVAAEFEEMLTALQEFHQTILRELQVSGQTAFYISYEDIQSLDVLNGLALWLGVDAPKDATNTRTKVQNPAPLRDKVSNYEEMVAALPGMDRFDLGRTPNFEPRRGPAVPGYVGAARTPLLFLPVAGGPRAQVEAWLAALDGVGEGDLLRGFSQKTLRQWKRQNPAHRSFTIVRHPVARLHESFVRHILLPGPDCYNEIRETLRGTYGLNLPDGAPGKGWSVEAQRAAFIAFAGFAKGNLGGQTSIRVDPAWASQVEVLQGMAQFALPDRVLREEEIAEELAALARATGHEAPPDLPAPPDSAAHPLEAVYDAAVEEAVRAAYQKDYMMFGYRAWR